MIETPYNAKRKACMQTYDKCNDGNDITKEGTINTTVTDSTYDFSMHHMEIAAQLTVPQKGTQKRKSALFSKDESLSDLKELSNALVFAELRETLSKILRSP